MNEKNSKIKVLINLSSAVSLILESSNRWSVLGQKIFISDLREFF